MAGLLPHDAAVAQAIERACQLGSSRSAAGSDDTSDGLSDTNRGDAQPAASKTSDASLVAEVLSPPQSPGELGRIGPYRVLKLLDAGGMGMVFLAEDPQLEHRVALKVVKPTLGTTDETRQRFLREARAAAAVRHDHIVTIYQVGEDRGVPPGHGAARRPIARPQLTRDGRLPAGEAVAIGRQIADGPRRWPTPAA